MRVKGAMCERKGQYGVGITVGAGLWEDGRKRMLWKGGGVRFG